MRLKVKSAEPSQLVLSEVKLIKYELNKSSESVFTGESLDMDTLHVLTADNVSY